MNPTPVTTGLNLYEKVDSDPNYAGVKDDSSDPDYAGIRNINPYAMVDGIGHADYAHIEERNKQASAQGSVIQRVQALESQSRSSMDTLNESYASVPPPPIPDKNFSLSENSSTLTPSAMPSTPQHSNSPSLPPRNGLNSAVVEDNGNIAITPEVTMAAGVISSDVSAGIVTMTVTDPLIVSTTNGRFFSLRDGQKS